MIILGLNGPAGAGKDTFGDLLRDEYGFHKVAYADRLREALYTLNPLISAWRDWDQEPGAVYIKDVIDRYGWEGYKKTHYNLEIRRLIQLMGTEVGRGIAGENVWIDATFRDIPEDTDRVVITDVRFPNEAQAILDRDGDIVNIVRPGVPNRAPQHASETSMNDWQFDFKIINNAHSIEEYREHIRAFMRYYLESDYRFFKQYLGE